jgi:hypothetical protein
MGRRGMAQCASPRDRPGYACRSRSWAGERLPYGARSSARRKPATTPTVPSLATSWACADGHRSANTDESRA